MTGNSNSVSHPRTRPPGTWNRPCHATSASLAAGRTLLTNAYPPRFAPGAPPGPAASLTAGWQRSRNAQPCPVPLARRGWGQNSLKASPSAGGWGRSSFASGAMNHPQSHPVLAVAVRGGPRPPDRLPGSAWPMQVERTLRPGQGGPQRPVLGLEDRDLHLQQLFGVHGGLLSVASTTRLAADFPGLPRADPPCECRFLVPARGTFSGLAPGEGLARSGVRLGSAPRSQPAAGTWLTSSSSRARPLSGRYRRSPARSISPRRTQPPKERGS